MPASPQEPPAVGCSLSGGRVCSSPARCAPVCHTVAWPGLMPCPSGYRTTGLVESPCPQTLVTTETWRLKMVQGLPEDTEKHVFSIGSRFCCSKGTFHRHDDFYNLHTVYSISFAQTSNKHDLLYAFPSLGPKKLQK